MFRVEMCTKKEEPKATKQSTHFYPFGRCVFAGWNCYDYLYDSAGGAVSLYEMCIF
jgi:hypothetical protein